MRITVNLSIFFHDHRSLAKIFIKNEMRYVKDVEDHISDIFNIENFYLKCENVYLPPTEDVQILHHDDIVWAVPIEDNVVYKKKKSKKQKSLPDSTPEAEQSVKDPSKESLSSIKSEDITPERKNKKVASLVHNFEKQLHESTKSPIEKRTNIVKTIIVSNKESNLATTNKKFNVSKEENLDLSGNCRGIQNGTLEPPKPSTSNNKHSNLQKDDQNNKSRKEDKFMDCTPTENTNIVKAIVISNKNTPGNRNLATTNSELNVSKEENYEINGNCSGVPNGTPEEPKPTTSHFILQKEDSLETSDDRNNKSRKEDEVMDYDSSTTWDTTSMCNSTTSEIQVGVTKRKRKRTRRRRQPETKEVFQQPVASFSAKPSVVQAATHIRFSDDQSKDVEVNQGDDCPKSEEVSASGVIVPDSEQNEEMKPEDVVTDVETSVAYKDTENSLNAGPKLGDIIDFRILRISENYTPELSSAIVGKVIDYDEDDKEVTFEVVYGLDQCIEPQGKFALNEEEQPQPVNNHFQCSWDSLLRPRLICR